MLWCVHSFPLSFGVSPVGRFSGSPTDTSAEVFPDLAGLHLRGVYSCPSASAHHLYPWTTQGLSLLATGLQSYNPATQNEFPPWGGDLPSKLCPFLKIKFSLLLYN